MHRISRRRIDRRRQRVALLQELMGFEIEKVDPYFFLRLKESKFLEEDKVLEVRQPNTLFNDLNYKDADYHKEFKTIYHLKTELTENQNKHYDPIESVPMSRPR